MCGGKTDGVVGFFGEKGFCCHLIALEGKVHEHFASRRLGSESKWIRVIT